MKLQNKINLFFVVILIVLSVSIVTVGMVIIDSIIYDLNNRILKLEIDNLKNRIQTDYAILRDAGVLDIPGYVTSAQDEIIRDFSKYKFGSSGNLFIINRDGTVVYHRDFRRGEPFNMNFFKNIRLKKTGNITYKYNDENKVARYVFYPEWNWYIILSLDEKEVYHLKSFYLTTVSAITFIILVIVFIVMLYSSQRVIGHLRKILDAFKNVEGGDLTTRVEVDSQDEFGELANSFNKMVTSLNDSTVSIEVLKEEEKRFQDIAESSGDWIWETDQSGRYVYSNPNVETMLGYRNNKVVGSYFYDFLCDEDRNKTRKLMLAQFEQKKTIVNFEHNLKAKNGEKVIVETSAVPVYNNYNQFTGYRGTNRDITQRKHAKDERVKLYQELQESSHLAGMSEVATSLLHNVGNILNSVNISCELILEKTEILKITSIRKIAGLLKENEDDLATFFSNDERAEMIPDFMDKLSTQMVEEQKQLLNEGKQLLSNIEHIKNIIKTQQHMAQGSGVKEEISLRGLVEESLKMNEANLKKRDIKVARHYQETPRIVTEKHKVIQILINLIRNAELAVEESANTPKLITIKVLKDDNLYLSVHVEDNGIGIPRENLSKIFNQGFTTRKSGNGFGLHISALAAGELGGSLTGKSDGAERGAIFILKLPLRNS